MWSKHLKLDVQEEFSSGEIETKKVKRKENSGKQIGGEERGKLKKKNTDWTLTKTYV